MKHKEKDIHPHLGDIAEAVHKVLTDKGLNGVHLTAMRFSSGQGLPCPPDQWVPDGHGGFQCLPAAMSSAGEA